MASPAQITASRANAQLSTGPRSVEGKAASSRNALKLGITAESMIIPGEDSAALDQLAAEYETQFEPDGPEETALVQSIIRGHWMQLRYTRIEADYLSARVAALPEGTPHPLGAAMIEDAAHGNTLQKIFRRQQAAERDWTRAIVELRKIQSERFAYEADQEALTAALPSVDPRPSRVRFDTPPQPPTRPAPAPVENLALRL